MSNVCFSTTKFRSKCSSNTVLCLLQNLMKLTLVSNYEQSWIIDPFCLNIQSCSLNSKTRITLKYKIVHTACRVQQTCTWLSLQSRAYISCETASSVFFDGFRTKRLMTESKTWVGLASLVRNFNPIIRCWERDLTKQFQDRLYFRSIIIFTFHFGWVGYKMKIFKRYQQKRS